MNRTLSLPASALATSAAGSDTAARKEQRTERKRRRGSFTGERLTKRPTIGPMLRKGLPMGYGVVCVAGGQSDAAGPAAGFAPSGRMASLKLRSKAIRASSKKV